MKEIRLTVTWIRSPSSWSDLIARKEDGAWSKISPTDIAGDSVSGRKCRRSISSATLRVVENIDGFTTWSLFTVQIQISVAVQFWCRVDGKETPSIEFRSDCASIFTSTLQGNRTLRLIVLLCIFSIMFHSPRNLISSKIQEMFPVQPAMQWK